MKSMASIRATVALPGRQPRHPDGSFHPAISCPLLSSDRRTPIYHLRQIVLDPWCGKRQLRGMLTPGLIPAAC